jgi:voltage-gated potassium channel
MLESGHGDRDRACHNRRMQAGGSGGPVRGRWRQARAAAFTAVLIAIATTVYYVVPVPGNVHHGSWVVLFCVGIVVLAALIVATIGRLLRAGRDVRIRALLLLLCIAVLFFSYANVVLAKVPGEFADLHSRTDSLYFAISTLSTVGFGDVHASGQFARVAITVEVVFNLVFIGMAVAMISGIMRTHVRHRLGGQTQGQPDLGGPAG